jgi:LysM domain-containing protein
VPLALAGSAPQIDWRCESRMTLGAERSQLLVRAKRILIAAGVLATGVLAAWPFRQDSPVRLTASAAPPPLELVLRKPEVVLSVSAPSDQSPAAGLAAVGGARPSLGSISTAAQASQTALRFDQLTPPPELPVAFHSSLPAENDRSGNTKPAPEGPGLDVGSRPVAQRRPRLHYVRDGDSLESLAERFLGSRERAGEIFAANRGTLSRPDLLPVGTKIVIPSPVNESSALTGPATEP